MIDLWVEATLTSHIENVGEIAIYIRRTLVVGGRHFSEEQLLQEGRVFIVLAEPGAGKTELMKALAARLNTVLVKASIFRQRPHVSGTGHLVIDAMDEVARIDSTGIDQIVASACYRRTETVIFAGRSSEWDPATTAYVEQCFGVKPVTVYLQPFNDGEQRQIFALEFPEVDFTAFATEVLRFELGPLLGNPQFLFLLGEAYIESGQKFTSKSQIFADAVKRLAHEANREMRCQKDRPPSDEIVALSGEVFAKLLLSGATGISTIEGLNDLDFPYVNSLCRDTKQSFFLTDTRLLKPSDDTDKHEPIHRIVAEYCAAGYLVKRIEDPGDRLSFKRVLAVVAPNGTTRNELRGMLGWMAALGQEATQLAAIKVDPYAVLANGDPSGLTSVAKLSLLTALNELQRIDPMFRRSDSWRRFNVGHFFTTETLALVRQALGKPGPLRDLLLELLNGTEASGHLLSELSTLLKDQSVSSETRDLVLQVLLGTSAYKPQSDLRNLINQASIEALDLASSMVMDRGVEAIGEHDVLTLLKLLADSYQCPQARPGFEPSRYFIKSLCRSFDLLYVVAFLNKISAGITCRCSSKHEYLCSCRHGISKITGLLLDRYFEIADEAHVPAQIWSWVKSLRFKASRSNGNSISTNYLILDHDLRRSIQQLAVRDATWREGSFNLLKGFGSTYAHAGIRIQEGDREALCEYSVEHGLIEVWKTLLVAHDVYGRAEKPNPLRTLQRRQAHSSPMLLAAWSHWERSWRGSAKGGRKAGWIRLRSNYAQKQALAREDNRAHLRQNLARIEAGQHFGWLKKFTELYLHKPGELADLVDDAETPLQAFRNCFSMLAPHIPTVEALGRGERYDIAEMLLAACLVRFRDGEDLGTVDKRVLAAAMTELRSYPVFSDGEFAAFEDAVDAALFRTPGSAESFVREYLEPQLAATQDVPVPLNWFVNKSAFKHLKIPLAFQWLDQFPRMPFEGVRSLFKIAAESRNWEKLRSLIDRRLSDTDAAIDKSTAAEQRVTTVKKFWQLNAFFYDAAGSDAAWEKLKTDPATIFAIEERLGGAGREGKYTRPDITAEKIFLIMDAFVENWPKVPLPSTWGSGDPDNERAYRFLRNCIWRMTEDRPERRIPILDRMVADPKFGDYRDAVLSLRAEGVRASLLQDFFAPRLAEINELLDRGNVATVEDLRALMVEQLGELQEWLKGAETDPLDMFYSDGKRLDENTARNRIVERLQGRMTALGLSVVVEHQLGGSNRCDITVSAMIAGKRCLLLTEVKGQWNRELYTAASAQLDQRYAIHPDAAKQGVYLVLWYGSDEKVAGHSDPAITTADILQSRIVSDMPVDLRTRVDVVVLDLCRPQKIPKVPNDQAHRRKKTLK